MHLIITHQKVFHAIDLAVEWLCPEVTSEVDFNKTPVTFVGTVCG